MHPFARVGITLYPDKYPDVDGVVVDGGGGTGVVDMCHVIGARGRNIS